MIYPLTGKQAFSFGSVHGWSKEEILNQLAYHKCSFELIKGWIPYTFDKINNKKFCFAHIDVDLYKATYDSLNFIYPRMLKGGIILLDDYGFPPCVGSKKAVDEYLKDKPEFVIVLATGQAFFIKQ
jgi:hypothetical protein